MNKKRYLIVIALIIFLFLALFTFANPFNDGEGGNPIDEIEEDATNKNEEKEEVKDTQDEEQEVVENTQQVVQEVVDNSYDLALKAVEKAEISLDKKDYDVALDLVNKVPNDKKNGLEERLAEVLNSINAKELVENLVKMTKSAENKKELDKARKYNTDNEVFDKVEDLKNEVLKETLNKSLKSIKYLLDDTKAPTINIEDEAILDSDTIIKVEDENKVTIKLNGKEIENNYEVSDGVYELVVTDEAFNEVKVNFIIDTIAPTATVNFSKGELTNEDVVVTLNPSEDIKVTNNDGKLEYTFTENGEFTFEFEDIAGNKGTVKVVVDYIDKELPVTNVSYSNEELTNEDVTVTVTVNEEIKEVEGCELSTDKKVLTKVFTENAEGTIEVYDLAGNKITVDYAVNNIDKDAPTIKDENGNSMKNQYDENGDLIEKYYKEVTPFVQDENIESIKINGITFINGTTIKLNGTFTIVATDKAGNTTEATFTVDNIAPKILLLDRLTVIRGNLIPIKPVIIDANLDEVIITLDGEDIHYKDGDQLTLPGKYEITAIDKAGNSSKTSFTMDNSGPEIYAEVDTNLLPEGINIPGVDDVVSIKLNIDSIEGLVSNLIAFQEVKLKVKEDNFDPKSIIVLRKSNKSINLPFDLSLPTYNKIDYTYGDTIAVEGEYIVLAADKALNISYGKFIIDRTAPKVNNIIPNEYNGEVTIDVEDANLSTIKLQKKILGIYGLPEYLSNGEVITESGEYKLTATDKANNKTVVEFKIDSEDPEIKGVTDKYIYNKEVSPVISDDNLDSVVVTKDGEVITSKTTYNEDGIYTITATDEAQNSVTVGFEIDKDAIKIEKVGDSKTSVTPQITSRGEITSIKLKKNGNLVDYTDTIDKAGNYELTVEDEYGNSVTVKFAVDLAAPVISASNQKLVALEGEKFDLFKNVTVTDDTDANPTLEIVSITHSNPSVTVPENATEVSIDPSAIGTYTVTYKATDDFNRTATETIEIVVFLSNTRIELDLTALETTYNGKDQKENIKACIYKTVEGIETLDVCEYNKNASKIDFIISNSDNELKNAGTYTITATIKNQPGNYEITASSNFTISPKEVDVTFTLEAGQTAVYDGTNKTYIATIETYESETPVEIYRTTIGKNAGNYELDATEGRYNNSNYMLNEETTTKTVTIETAELVAYIKSVDQEGNVTPGFKYANEGEMKNQEFSASLIPESEIKIEVNNDYSRLGIQIVIIDVEPTKGNNNYSLTTTSIDLSIIPSYLHNGVNRLIERIKKSAGIDGQVFIREI